MNLLRWLFPPRPPTPEDVRERARESIKAEGGDGVDIDVTERERRERFDRAARELDAFYDGIVELWGRH